MFIVLNAQIKNLEISQINSLTLHLEEIEKEQQTTHKASRRQEIIKIRDAKKVQEFNKSRSLLFERINKRPLARVIKEKREKIQIKTNRNDKGDITTDSADMQNTFRDYYEHL